MLRATIAVEKAGFPAVSFVGSIWEGQAVATARFFGMADPPLAVYPGRLTVDDAATFEEKLRTVVAEQVVAGLTTSSPSLIDSVVEPARADIVFSGGFDAVQEHFHELLWSDGLPVVPPTVDRVERFLAFTARDPGEVIGLLAPERRDATVWNVAVNGVMAGCRPEYMPVLLAVVEAIADPRFGLENAGSGIGWEPLVTVHGPAIRELGFNFGSGVRRVGRQANTSVGRFLRLYIRNVAGLRIPPGEYDEGRLGGGLQIVLAEDEDQVRALGWPTYGEDRGLAPGESGVTVQSVAAESPVFGEFGGDLARAETWLAPLVEVFGKAILGYWSWTGMVWSSWHPLFVLSPQCARILARQGWTKDAVRRYLFEQSRVPASRIQELGNYANLDIPALVGEGRLPPDFLESDDPERLIPTFVRPEWTGIVIAGGTDSIFQRGFMNNHEHGPPTTRRIELL